MISNKFKRENIDLFLAFIPYFLMLLSFISTSYIVFYIQLIVVVIFGTI